jgi:hypothetical protein
MVVSVALWAFLQKIFVRKAFLVGPVRPTKNAFRCRFSFEGSETSSVLEQKSFRNIFPSFTPLHYLHGRQFHCENIGIADCASEFVGDPRPAFNCFRWIGLDLAGKLRIDETFSRIDVEVFFFITNHFFDGE